MKSDVLYWFMSHMLDAIIWGGEFAGNENLPVEGPAVYVSNHALALGPIAVAASLPVRIYPWVISDMLDWQKAAAYLCLDFVEPQLHIPPPLSMLVSRLISQISVRLLRRVGSIPVWRFEEVIETYHISLDRLVAGQSLLIFPEDPIRPMDEQSRMRPFMKGFARLGELYFERTQQILKFYPLAVHAGLRKVNLGKPVSFNPKNNPANECVRIKSVLESIIRGMVIEMTLQGYAGIPLPH
jgi:1-acyl-sn-glycerol-3-phosphate acyltransferase